MDSSIAAEQKNTLESILANKRELLRLFVLATVLAFSVGVLASLIAAQTAIPTSYVVAGSLALTLLALVLLAADLRHSFSFEDKLEGILFVDPQTNELLAVEDYEFSEDLAKILGAVRAENRAIYSEWQSGPLVEKKATKPPESPPEEAPDKKPTYFGIYRVTVEEDHLTAPKAVRLLEEAILFALIEELSTHLSTYFQGMDDEEVETIQREHIPSFLLQNRVLNLLSTPIEQRDIFLTAFPDKEKRPEGELHSLWSSDGAMYSRFDLSLPKGSRISHTEAGGVRISTKRLELELSSHYTGTTGTVSPAFVGYYMERDWQELSYRNVEVTLRCRIKPLALLSTGGWDHYRWLDSFRSRLKSSVDFRTFLGEIHWDVIEPTLYSLRGQFNAVRRQIAASAKRGREA